MLISLNLTLPRLPPPPLNSRTGSHANPRSVPTQKKLKNNAIILPILVSNVITKQNSFLTIQPFSCILNMGKITCYYYCTDSGRIPVREFIDSLDYRSQRKFFFAKALLEEFGYRLPRPHAAYIGDSIFELRFKGAEGQIRILYFFFHQNKAILTNGFVKKTNKVSKKVKEVAIKRKKRFIERHENKKS